MRSCCPLPPAISGAAPPIAITLGGLAGLYLLGADKSLATLPVTGFNLGVALGAIPAAMLMRRIGRRARLHDRRAVRHHRRARRRACA